MKLSWRKRKNFKEWAKTVTIAVCIVTVLFLMFTLYITGRNYLNLSGLHDRLQEQVDFIEGNAIEEYNFWYGKYWKMREAYHDLLNQVDASLIEGNQSFRIFGLTGYSANDPEQGTNETTAIGFKLKAHYMDYIGIIAVDPDVIPLGSVVFIRADYEGLGYTTEKMFIAGDTGGAIVGERIDVYFDTKQEAKNFGLQAGLVRWISREDYKTIEE